MPAKRKSKTYFSRDGVSVTRRRAKFGDDEIPVPDIENVTVTSKVSRDRSGCFWAVAGVCFVVAGSCYGESLKLALFFLGVGFVAALISFKAPGRIQTFRIRVAAESGIQMEHKTTDQAVADRIIDALNDAVLDAQEAAQEAAEQETA